MKKVTFWSQQQCKKNRVVTHVIHNGQQNPPTFQSAGSLPANKTLSGIKTHEYKGGRHNEIIFDDTTNEIRTTLSTEHGKTQLNQGFLIHPRSEGKGAPRGEGFELRTDNAGAIRSAQGLLLTTEAQQNARGKQLDRSPALAQLEAAQNLTKQLGDTAQQRANKPNPDPALNADQLKDKKPHILLHGHGGAAITTPKSVTLATGKDLNQVSPRDTHQTSGRRWIHNVGESASIFVANAQTKQNCNEVNRSERRCTRPSTKQRCRNHC
ncbi:MAG: type VI secretion system Vgr family protein [Spongiibacteraceae bacterium]